MLTFFPAFIRYVIWGFEFLFFPPLCLAGIGILVSLILAIIKQNPFSNPEVRGNTLRIVIAQTFIFALTVSIAVLGFVDQTYYHGPNERALNLEMALSAASAVLSIYRVIRMKGYRWYATSLSPNFSSSQVPILLQACL